MKPGPVIRVRTYSGYRSDEYPLSFFLEDRERKVERIIDRYYNPEEDLFKVKADDGLVYILARHRGQDSWSLRGGQREYN